MVGRLRHANRLSSVRPPIYTASQKFGIHEICSLSNFCFRTHIQAYVTWYSVSNFFVPFVVLLFCYGRMCVALYTNFKNKKDQQQGGKNNPTGDEEAAALRADQLDEAQNFAQAVLMENGRNGGAIVVEGGAIAAADANDVAGSTGTINKMVSERNT